MKLTSLFSVAVIALAICFAGAAAHAQTYNPFNERDNTYTLLGLKRAQQAYRTAQAELERQQELFDRGLISSSELDVARNVFTDAEVNYQQSLLTVLFEKQYVSVTGAVKYRGTDGSKRVRLTLENTTTGTTEFQKLVNIEDELFRSLQPDRVPNVYVSILNEDNAIISQPYETKIPELVSGEPVVLDFGLLQDLDEVTVFMIYGNGNQRTMKIFLQKDESEDRVLVQSEQFSQEVELGSASSFDLTLELFSGSSNTFTLETVNLPEQIGRFFRDSRGEVRLKQVKFTESSRTKTAALEITLPDRPGDDIVLEQPIQFYVLALPPDKQLSNNDIRNKRWTNDEIKALSVGYVQLELIPRGRGELLVRIPQLFQTINAEDTATFSATFLNEGSHRLDNIEVDVDLPFNWTYELSPRTISSLSIGNEQRMEMTFVPPEDIAPGRYNIRVRSSALSNGEPITGEDKSITVEIKAGANVLSTILILVFLVALIGGIVVFGIKLSRK